MESITVKKAELLKQLRENRSNHEAIFKEALEGYRVEVIELLEHSLEQARIGQKIHTSIYLVEPVNQVKDYTRAIRMLEMSVDDEITLSETDFAQYVLDDWNWTEQFLTTNTPYLGKT